MHPHRTRRAIPLIVTLIAAAMSILPGAQSHLPALHLNTTEVTCLCPIGDTVWVGTGGGCLLWPADGNGVPTHISTENELLSSNAVADICPGPVPGSVAVATRRGLCILADEGDGWTPVAGASLPGRATALCVGAEGLLAAVDGQLYIAAPRVTPWQWAALGLPLPTPARCVYRGADSVLAGTAGGLYRLNADAWEKLIHSEAPLAAMVNDITSLGETLYVATAGGLFRFEEGVWACLGPAEGLPDAHVTALTVRGEDLYIGTFGGGAAILRKGRITAVHGSPGYITSLGATDKAIWAGTPESGVRAWNGATWQQLTRPGEPPGNNITGVAAGTGGDVWIGTFDRGVGRLREGMGWSSMPTGDLWINHLCFGRGRPWARTSGGDLLVPDKDRWRKLTRQDGLLKDWTSSVQVSGGNVWVGTWGAVSKFDGKKWHHFAPKPALEGQVVTSVATMGPDIWVGTAKGGLCRYNGESGLWETYSLGSGITDTWVTCLDVWDGRLWVGTFSGGLCSWDGRNWRSVRAPSPLPSDRINCLAHDRDLYVGTLDGLVIYDGNGWEPVSRELLPHETVQSLCVNGPRLWVGTPEGLAWLRLAAQ